MKSKYQVLLTAFISLIWLTIVSCNDRPVVPLDQALNSSSAQAITVGAKTKIDILFVIDESQSMRDEQVSLAENFSTFSDFIFVDLKNAADYRIAITSTGASTTSTVYPDALGSFVSESTPENQMGELNCPATLNPVISPASIEGAGCAPQDVECQREQLRFQFSCLAQVGIAGVNNERGLEAMRSGLSCNGPNGHLFGRCCQPDNVSQTLQFDPICRGGGEEPEFLRPDAFLMVVFITDEDDCSTFASAGVDSPYATCQADPKEMQSLLADGTDNGRAEANSLIFTKYSNPGLCPDGDTACYNAECTDSSGQLMDPVDCYYKYCELRLPNDTSEASYGNACRWQADKLAPIEFYFEFLNGLKVRPTEQLLIANIVAPGLLTSTGDRLSFSEEKNLVMDCERGPNRDYNACCPNGDCKGIYDFSSCQSGSGYSSWRYIDLMTMFGESGLGCREGQNGGCVEICNPDLTEALGQLRAKLISAVGDYCVARRPACLVSDPMTGGSRLCRDDEVNQPANYQLRIKQVCEVAPEEGGACGLVDTSRYLALGASADYTLEINDPACPSGMRVQLTSPPPAGSTTEMEILQSLVELEE